MSTIILLRSSVSILAVLSLTGCRPQTLMPPTETTLPGAVDSITPVATDTLVPPTEAATVQVTALPTGAASATATYSDEYAGFAFDYPVDWYLVGGDEAIPTTEWTNYGVNVTNWDPSDLSAAGLEGGGTKVDIIVWKGAEESLEATVAAQKAEWEKSGAPVTIVSEENVILGGMETVRFYKESPLGNLIQYIGVLDGNTIFIAGYGDLELADSVIRTFRLAP